MDGVRDWKPGKVVPIRSLYISNGVRALPYPKGIIDMIRIECRKELEKEKESKKCTFCRIFKNIAKVIYLRR